MEEITDEESARAWLEGKPREMLVAFAARAAIRALPGIAGEEAATLDRIVLPVLRAIIASSVATVRPTDDMKTAARSSSSATLSAAFSEDNAVFSALSAARSAESAVFSATRSADAAALSAAFSAESAARSAESAGLSADSAALSAA